jgi:hypothetical protein
MVMVGTDDQIQLRENRCGVFTGIYESAVSFVTFADAGHRIAFLCRDRA